MLLQVLEQFDEPDKPNDPHHGGEFPCNRGGILRLLNIRRTCSFLDGGWEHLVSNPPNIQNDRKGGDDIQIKGKPKGVIGVYYNVEEDFD